VIYGLILVFLQDLFQISSIWNIRDIGILLAIVLISWLPIYGIHLLRLRIDPTDDEKIIQRAFHATK